MRTSLRGETIPHAGRIHATFLDSAAWNLRASSAPVRVRRPLTDPARAAQGGGGDGRLLSVLVNPHAFQLRIHFPTSEVFAMSAEKRNLRLVGAGRAGGACGRHVVVREHARVRSGRRRRDSEHLVVGFYSWNVDLHHVRRLPPYLDWFLHGSLFWSLGIYEIICFFWGHALVFSFFIYFLFVVLLLLLFFITTHDVDLCATVWRTGITEYWY